jgi:hypothetical protein
LLDAAEKVSRYIEGAMSGEVGKIIRFADQKTFHREVHV